MSSLLELAIDLINDAKGGGDAQSKLYLLEQVKEIVFHRDKTILKDIIPSILDFMVEKAVPIRKYLIRFGEDSMAQDPSVSFPYYLNLCNFLAADSNDNVLSLLVKGFQKYYDTILMSIVSMPIQQKAQGLSDPKQLWQIVMTLTSKFNDFIATNKSDSLKGQCLRFLESQMTFGLPSPAPAAADPRLARKDPRLARAGRGSAANVPAAAAGSSSKNADEIPLHHPFISRNEVQSAAEDHFTRVLLWASKGGPQNHPFSPALMSVLGQVISNVATSRLKNATPAAMALVAMIQGKGGVCQEMSGMDRENLARAVHRLLRAATAYTADPEGVMPKLRAAVAVLEAMGLDGGKGGAGDVGGQDSMLRKRSRGTAVGADGSADSALATATTAADEDENEEALAQLRSSAAAAIDAAEQKMKAGGSAFPDFSMLDGGDDGSDAIAMLLAKVSTTAGKGASKASVGIGGILISGDSTELSRDLATWEDPASLRDLKLVTAAQSKAASGSAASAAQEPLPPSSDGYADLALCSLKKVLDSYQLIESTNPKMLGPFSVMCVKTLLSSVLTELESGRPLTPVQIVAIVPTSTAGRLSDDVPAHVMLPMALWVMLGFTFTPQSPAADSTGTSTSKDTDEEEQLAKKVQLLLRLCRAIQEELAWLAEQRDAGALETSADDKDPVLQLRAVYDALCVAAMSRMVQVNRLRSSLPAFMLGLPVIPSSCISILKLLVVTGTKNVPPPPVGPRGNAAALDANKSRGTRAEALSLLGQLVFSQDEIAGKGALSYVLQCCISEDFELRTKAIQLVVNEIVHIEDWCDEIVATFALQAMVGALGAENVQAWYDAERAARGACGEVGDGDVGCMHEAHHTGEEPLDPDSMDVAEHDGDQVHEGATVCATSSSSVTFRSLYHAYGLYNSPEWMHFAFPEVAAAGREAYTKRAVQLLSQLCLVDLPMLGSFADLYSAWALTSVAALPTAGPPGETVSADTSVDAMAESAEADQQASAGSSEEKTADAEGSANIVAPAEPITKVAWSLAETIKSELRNVLPAIGQSSSAEQVFSALAHRPDPAVIPLLSFALNLLLADHTSPSTAGLISTVRGFVNRVCGTTESVGQEPNVGGIEEHVLSNVSDTAGFKLVLQLVGGLATQDIESSLPRIVDVLADDADALKAAFSRMTKARPAPLTKSALVVALHRIDFEGLGINTKAVLGAIAVCLNNKSDFSGEVIRDALKSMLSDEPLPYALMRTAILSAQSFSEVKRYVLSDVIPQLVRRRVWAVAPKLWDGVVFGAKNLATTGFKNSELTLRALLGIPAVQLKYLLKVAPTVKPAMGKLLKTLSAEEKEEVTSGRWAGISYEEEHAGLAAEVVAKHESDKQKLLKEIAATATI